MSNSGESDDLSRAKDLAEQLRAKPELLADAESDALQGILDSTNICNHYESLKAQRPLLEEEKRVGKKLLGMVELVAARYGS